MEKAIRIGRSILIAALLLAGCTNANSGPLAETKQEQAEQKHGDPAFNIPDSQLIALKEKAYGGDGEAALRLSLYYRYWMEDLEAEDLWVFVGIADGYKPAMFKQAVNFSRSEFSQYPLLRLRARHWFEQLKEDPLYRHAAQQYLDEMDSSAK
jgi:hypothetical protein